MRLSLGAILAIYIGLLAGWIAIPALFAPRLGLAIGTGTFGLAGITYLVAATGWPWWLFEGLGAIMRLGPWESRGRAQAVLATLGGLLFLIAVMAQAAA